MMKKIIYLLLISLVAFTFACGSGEVKKDDKGDAKVDPRFAKVNELNGKLDAVAVKDFAEKKAALPKSWAKWLKDSSAVVKDAVAALPEGYVLEICGHIDTKEEDAMGKGKAAKSLSAERAMAVKAALKKAKVDSPNIVSKGITDTKVGAMVTFRVVAK
jgi:hypothetical protein